MKSLQDSVIREMKEETGLTIKNPKLCGVKGLDREGRHEISCSAVQNRSIRRRIKIIRRRPRLLDRPERCSDCQSDLEYERTAGDF